uniref:Uncharacterized protein n=1 Tax=Oryza glumipatula TaxID=40148 RepID=A0A0D9YQD1_9ORYZ
MHAPFCIFVEHLNKCSTLYNSVIYSFTLPLALAASIDELDAPADVLAAPHVRHHLANVVVVPPRRALVVRRRVEARLRRRHPRARRVRHRRGRLLLPPRPPRHDPRPQPREPLRDVAEGGEAGGEQRVAGAEQVHLAQRPHVVRRVAHPLQPLVARLVHATAAATELVADLLVVPRAQ